MRHPNFYGVGLVMVSALVFSSAGLFVKSVTAGSWEVIFWRGIFAIGFSLVFVILRHSFRRELLAMGKPGLAVALVGALGTGAFVPAFKLTTVANVSLIYAAAPIIAALLARFFVGEKISRQTMAAIGLAFVGVAIIFSGSLGQVHLSGDLLALFMTLMMASMIVIYRAFPDTPVAGPSILSSVLLLAPAFALGKPFDVAGGEIAILAVFGGLFAIASITLGEGARRIPASQTALLSALETPLAPLLAWLFLAENPAFATYIGGALVLAAIIWAQLGAAKEARPNPPSSPRRSSKPSRSPSPRPPTPDKPPPP